MVTACRACEAQIEAVFLACFSAAYASVEKELALGRLPPRVMLVAR